MSGISPSTMKAGIIKSLASLTSKVSRSVRRLSLGICSEDRYNGLEAAGSNLSASGSRIADAESARRIIVYTKSRILSRADLSVSGQANQTQRRIISLIQ